MTKYVWLQPPDYHEPTDDIALMYPANEHLTMTPKRIDMLEKLDEELAAMSNEEFLENVNLSIPGISITEFLSWQKHGRNSNG